MKKIDIWRDTTNLKIIGGSSYFLIPTHIRKKMDLLKGDEEVEYMIDVGKHGIFIAIWNPAQQEGR
jgi:hypothetical protein